MSLACITNETPGVPSCRQKGAHLSTCDGRKLNGKDCGGCLPHPAERGLLCWNCWEKLVVTLTRWPEFAATISGLKRLVTPEAGGSSSAVAGYVPLAQTWMDVDEAESFLLSLTAVKANTDLWVSSVAGASDSIQFVRLAERAFRTHPLEESAHRVTTVCSKCSLPSLVWEPVANVGGQVSVVCRNPDCGFEYDQSSFELLAELEGRKK
jgi:hypothetical protein